jgi:hypothetical protein
MWLRKNFISEHEQTFHIILTQMSAFAAVAFEWYMVFTGCNSYKCILALLIPTCE